MLSLPQSETAVSPISDLGVSLTSSGNAAWGAKNWGNLCESSEKTELLEHITTLVDWLFLGVI